MKWLIVDRDGVINVESDAYIKSPDEWQPIPGSLEAIARLSQAGYRVYVATNQSGVGRGLFDTGMLLQIFQKMQKAAAELGGRFDGIEFAPEHPDQATDLRKPAPGMLRDLARRLQTPLDGVPFIGDTASDVQAARAAGARPVLVRTGRGRASERDPRCAGVEVYDDLASFVDALLAV